MIQLVLFMLQKEIVFFLMVAISHDGTRIVSGSPDRTIRVWHLESFTHSQPIVCFSSNPTHALCSTISILQESHMSSLEASDLIPTRERWIAGPEGQHLLWIPSYFPSITYAPGNTLVIPDALQLDFSHFSRAHHGRCVVNTRQSQPSCLL